MKLLFIIIFLLPSTCFSGPPSGTVRPNSAGGVDVAIQDQTTAIVDLYLHWNIPGTYSINSNSVMGTYTIVMNSTTMPTVGDYIGITEYSRYYQGSIVSFTGSNPYTLSLDTPLDYSFTTAAGIHLAEIELNVDGSSAAVVYHISPPAAVLWDITRILFYIEDGSAMDSGLFGGIPALTRGLVLRKKNGEYFNIFNVKTNGEFAQRAYDVAYTDKAPAGVFGFTCRRTLAGQNKNGVTIRLDGSLSDELQVIIQDDLTALDHVHVVVQGHVVQLN